jgi:hypothetical protein
MQKCDSAFTGLIQYILLLQGWGNPQPSHCNEHCATSQSNIIQVSTGGIANLYQLVDKGTPSSVVIECIIIDVYGSGTK